MLRAQRLQLLDVLGLADDVDQTDAVIEADAVEHQPEVRGTNGVDQRGVSLGSHRLDHAERGQRIDERSGSVGRIGAVGHHETLADVQRAVLGVGVAGQETDGLAEQCLRGR